MGFYVALSTSPSFTLKTLPEIAVGFLETTKNKILNYVVFRKKKKQNIKSATAEGLITVGQNEVLANVPVKNNGLNSLKRHKNPGKSSENCEKNKETKSCESINEVVNVNVIILQSSTATKVIKEMLIQNLLTSVKKEDEERKGINHSDDVDSPVILRKPAHSKSRTLPLTHHKPVSAMSTTMKQPNRMLRQQQSEVYYSLESNLDQNCPPPKPNLPPMGEKDSGHMSSLPSMTSGRFYSANSSVMSGVSSPRSDLSPSKESDCKGDEDIHQSKHYIEPIVEVIDTVDGATSDKEENFSEGLAYTTEAGNNNGDSRRTRNSNPSFLTKSQSLTSDTLTNDGLTNDNNNIEVCKDRKNSVKFDKSAGLSKDNVKKQRKYMTLPLPLPQLRNRHSGCREF